MSWSLALRNGDLVLGGTQLAAVAGTAKLVQDLRCAILEPMGTDDLHPAFGSLIDGGRRPDGTAVSSPLGGSDWKLIAMNIEAELRRILDNHRSRQLGRARSDQFTYGRPTLSPGELLISVNNIEMISVQDTLVCRVTLGVGDGTDRTLNIPLTSEPVITS